ncbi:hypothetical protein D3C86_2033330 [compost metagenome]
MLEAQTRLFDQQRVQQQVRAARLAAHAELMAALGGGLLDPQRSPAEHLLEPQNVPVAHAGAAPQ